jgi:hypothetical protein
MLLPSIMMVAADRAGKETQEEREAARYDCYRLSHLFSIVCTVCAPFVCVMGSRSRTRQRVEDWK